MKQIFVPKIWILEDDEDAVLTYQTMFGNQYDIRYLKTLSELKSLIKNPEEKKPDLLIADIRLPDGNFTEYVRGEPRGVGMNFAVITAADEVNQIQSLFSLGAKDFFVKPVNKNEMLVKIDRLLNLKNDPTTSKTLPSPSYKELALDTFDQGVTRTGVEKMIQLTQTEYKILALFFRNQERRLNRDEIISEVWKNEILSPKAFDFHLSKLREKLKDLRVRILYQTNEGYTLVQDA